MTACSRAGFTLIELLVVISIIGLLSSAVLTSMQSAQFSAQYAVAEQEMRLIADTMILAGDSFAPILSITGDSCTMCTCRDASVVSGVDLRTVEDDSPCMDRWRTSLTAITDDSPLINNPEQILRDPWGSPYLLDENESEFSDDPCRADWLRTVGPDGEYGTAADFVIRLPFRTAECR